MEGSAGTGAQIDFETLIHLDRQRVKLLDPVSTGGIWNAQALLEG